MSGDNSDHGLVNFSYPLPCSAPDAQCKNASVYLNMDGNVSISVNDINNGSSVDANCTPIMFEVSPNTLNCSNEGPNAVMLTVKDSDGNESSCTSTVTVIDNILPSVSCPGEISVEYPDLVPAPDVNLLSYDDNCGGAIVPIYLNDVGDGNTNPEILTRTYQVTDANGNPNTCTQKITILNTYPIPTMSQWGLIFLSLCLVIWGTVTVNNSFKKHHREY